MLPDSILPTPEDDIARVLRDYERRLSHLERLEQGGLGLGARVFNSGNLTTASSGTLTLTFDSERFDTDNIHSVVANTSRLTATTAGIYSIAGAISFDTNVTGVRAAAIQLNGGSFIAWDLQRAATTFGNRFALSTIWELAAGDFVELGAFQDSGGNLDVLAVIAYSPEFMMVKVG